MAVVVFDYSAWALRYPELAPYVSAPAAQVYFNEAQIYCDNSDFSPVQNIGLRTTYLNMLTAHIAALNAPINSAPSSPLVGRIASASEGSVNVSTQNDYEPGTAQWFQQTKYGSAYWTATVRFRSAKYVPACGRVVDPYAPYRGR